MPLVEPLSPEHDPEVAELAVFFNETLGFCPNSVLTMQRRPHIAKAFIQLNKAVMQNDGRVSSDLKRLIGYIASMSAGCQYCQAHTIRAAERYGASIDKLEHIWDFRTHPALTRPNGQPWNLPLRHPPFQMQWMTTFRRIFGCTGTMERWWRYSVLLRFLDTSTVGTTAWALPWRHLHAKVAWRI